MNRRDFIKTLGMGSLIGAAALPIPLINAITFKKNKPKLKLINNMVHIKSGSFMMGSPETEIDRNYNEDLHYINLTNDFYMGAYPVTQEEWEDLMGYNPIIDNNCDNYSKPLGSKKPIIFISWTEANKYCEKLTAREQEKGNIPKDWHYCLPTEAQWEYACRAGSQERYYNGYTNLDDIAWYGSNSKYEYSDVGQKQPNAWGLYDMLGNVWELCSDFYEPYVLKNDEKGVINPAGPNNNGNIQIVSLKGLKKDCHVSRGGCCFSFDRWCRCASRNYDDNLRGWFNLGMRIVCCLKKNKYK